MAVELLANLAASTLSADITSTSATTLTVTSATGFPAAATGTSQFRILIGTEIMIVTNVSGTTFTVTRGAESTTAATHTSGDPVTHVVTAGVFQAMFGGGTAGQALTKTGSADYAASWTTPGWGGGAYFRTGYYSHGVDLGEASVFSMAATLNTAYARPFLVPGRQTFDRLGVSVSTAATAASGGVVRMGIYQDGGGKPGTLVVDAGTIGTESTGAKEITISQTLDPGLYWIVTVAQVATCSMWAYGAIGVTSSPNSTGPISGINGMTRTQASVTGALPSTFTPSTGNASGSCPATSLRAA